MNKKLEKIIGGLNEIFIEREELIRLCMVVLISKEHLLMLGAPGTAKSDLTQQICKSIIGTKYYKRLLTKHSVPEEIFGPISMKGLENDIYKRIVKNKLPEAHIAFLDEIFKANSAILNSLLLIINEREYDNDIDSIECPLNTLFGASNELPSGEELNALWDRFLIRYFTEYIKEEDEFRKLFKINRKNKFSKITLDELIEIQEEVNEIEVDDTIIDFIVLIKRKLKEKGIVISDRRWKKSINLIKANSYLNNDGDKINIESMEILVHILWESADNRKDVYNIIMEVVNPSKSKAKDFEDMAFDIYESSKNMTEEKDLIDAHVKLKKIMGEIEKLIDNFPHSKYLKKVYNKIGNMHKQLYVRVF